MEKKTKLKVLRYPLQVTTHLSITCAPLGLVISREKGARFKPLFCEVQIPGDLLRRMESFRIAD